MKTGIRLAGAAMLLIAAFSLSGGCRRQDMRTAIVRCPGMKTQACADIIVDTLREASYGVRMDGVRMDLETRIVKIEYDSMLLSLKNIEFLIAKAGFDANEVPADPDAAAALPDECR